MTGDLHRELADSPANLGKTDANGIVGLQPIDSRLDHAQPDRRVVPLAAEHLGLDANPLRMKVAAKLPRHVIGVDFDRGGIDFLHEFIERH